MSPIWVRRGVGVGAFSSDRTPGRIVLIDTDTPGETDTSVDVAALAATGEPQLVVRAGGVSAARLARWNPRRSYRIQIPALVVVRSMRWRCLIGRARC